MEKLKEHKGIAIVILVAIFGAFYWIQIRPVSIKKECSWFTETIPAYGDVNLNPSTKSLGATEGAVKKQTPEEWLANPMKAPAQPEKKILREATKSEYDTCLRHNGL